MKRTAAAFLIFLLPAAALAQNPAPPKVRQSKTKWIAIGSVIGGTGLALAAAASNRNNTLSGGTGSRTNSVGGVVSSSVSSVVSVGASASICSGTTSGGVTSTPCLAPIGTSVTPGSVPAAAPGALGAFGAPTYIATLTTNQGRGANWKMIGPAIGVASVGTILLYRDHQNKKRAEVSLKSQSAVQLAFSW